LLYRIIPILSSLPGSPSSDKVTCKVPPSQLIGTNGFVMSCMFALLLNVAVFGEVELGVVTGLTDRLLIAVPLIWYVCTLPPSVRLKMMFMLPWRLVPP